MLNLMVLMFCFSYAAWSCVPENQIWISRSSYSQGTGNCVLLLVAGHLFMVCILPLKFIEINVIVPTQEIFLRHCTYQYLTQVGRWNGDCKMVYNTILYF